MNPQLWILFTFLAISSVSPSPSCCSRSPSSPSSPSSNLWFREKYLIGAHDTYYDYTINRFDLDDNDRDMCPDVYKSATIFAITGRYMNKIKMTCNAKYLRKITIQEMDDHIANSTLIPQEVLQHIVESTYIILSNVLTITGILVCYTFEIGMIIMSVLLALCSTIFMMMLLFCQY